MGGLTVLTRRPSYIGWLNSEIRPLMGLSIAINWGYSQSLRHTYSQGQSNRKISIFVKPPNRPVRFIFYIFRATLQVIWFLKGS